jgi:hypothetical protein
MNLVKRGVVGWAGLALFVGAWDYASCRNGGQTLSSAFLRASRHPIRRWPLLAAALYLNAHLWGLLPERFDPLAAIAAHFRGESVSPRKTTTRPA